MTPTPESVLNYWLGTLNSELDFPSDNVSMWFNGGDHVDNEIKERFSSLWQLAAGQQLNNWLESTKGRMALIILLDQFSRNLFRNDPQAFAQDDLALKYCLEGIALGTESELLPVEKYFYYMPLEHSESIEMQELSVKKYFELMTSAPVSLKSYMEVAYEFAVKHYDIIESFGRFPHRNEVLGRISTGAELEHLEKFPGF